MDTASRHARRIADSFIDDLDNMRRNSRNADRRAMSHFETSSSYNPAITYPVNLRRRVSTSRERTLRPVYVEEVQERPARHSRISTQGSRVPLRDHTSLHDFPERGNFARRVYKTFEKYSTEEEEMDYEGKTKDEIGTIVIISPMYSRSISQLPEMEFETPIRKTIRRSVVSSRLGSVPPTGTYTTVNDARVITPRVYTTLSSGLPPRTPSRMMSSVITTREVPSVMSNYSTYRYPETIIEPISIRSSYTPIYHQFYSGAPSGYVPSRGLYSSGSYNDLSSDRLRRINRRIDDELLEYKPLSDDYFRKMRGSLRSLNDKISTHKKLIDRYSGIDMSTANDSVADHIDLKYRELTDRMGRNLRGMGRV